MPTFHHPARVDVIEGGADSAGALVLGGLGLGAAFVFTSAIIAWVAAHALIIAAVVGGIAALSTAVTAVIVRYLYRHHTVIYWRTARPAPRAIRAEVLRLGEAARQAPARAVPGRDMPAIQAKRARTVPGEVLEGVLVRRRGEHS